MRGKEKRSNVFSINPGFCYNLDTNGLDEEIFHSFDDKLASYVLSKFKNNTSLGEISLESYFIGKGRLSRLEEPVSEVITLHGKRGRNPFDVCLQAVSRMPKGYSIKVCVDLKRHEPESLRNLIDDLIKEALKTYEIPSKV